MSVVPTHERPDRKVLPPVDVLNNLEGLCHFYYCLLVALKMHKQQFPVAHTQAKRRFLQNWLRTAQERKRFCVQVYPEIQWLREELISKTTSPCTIERNIALIYYRAQAMQDDALQTHINLPEPHAS